MKRNLFLRILGNNTNAKLIYYFLNLEKEIDISIIDILENTNIKSRKTIDKIINILLLEKLIESTRTIGKTRLFRINKKSLIMKRFMQIKTACNEN